MGATSLADERQPAAPPGPIELFEADLARLGRRAPTARLLLEALAWARGPGFGPEGGIWLAAAQALAHSPDGLTASRSDIRWLVGAADGHVTAGAGRAYRLTDALVAAHLRGEPAGRAANGQPWRDRRACAERRITGGLLAAVPADGPVRDWAGADPYLRAHLAQHAAAAGADVFAELIRDAGFLAAAEPQTLLPLLSVAATDLRGLVRTYRRASPLLGGDPRANAALLEEAALAEGVTGPWAPGGPRPRYRTMMASVRRDDSLLTLTGHTAMVYGVAFGVTADRRLLLASGSDDGTIRTWDPFTGTQTLPPLTGHGDVGGVGVAPWGQTMKPSETYWTTGLEVEAVTFGTTADGRLLLASVGCDRTVRVWDPLTGAAVGEPLTGHTGRIWNMAACRIPDGRLLLASGGDDMDVRIWDADALAPVGGPLTGHTDQIVMVALCVTADGRCLLASASSDCTVRLWDPLAGTALGSPLTGHDAPVFAVRFGTAPGGRLLLASGSEDTTIRIWDPLTGEPVGTPLTGHTDRVDGLAFFTAPDGRWLLVSCSRDQTIRLWDPLACVQVGDPLIGHTSWVFSLALGSGPDGPLLATGCADKTIKIWDLAAATAPGEPPGEHTRWVTSAAFGAVPGGPLRLATGSGDGTIGVWDPATGALASSWSLPLGPRDAPPVACAATQDGRLLLAAGSGDGTIRVWDALAGTPVGEPVVAHHGSVCAVAFGTAPGGPLLLATGGTDKAARLWDPLTGDQVGKTLAGHQGWVRSLAFYPGPDGRPLLATCGDTTICFWEPLTGTPARPHIAAPDEVYALAVAARRRGRPLLASGGDAAIRLWDPITGRPVGQPFTGHDGWITSLAFSTGPGARMFMISGSGDGTVRLWSVPGGACLGHLRRERAVRAVAASGLTLALGDDGGIAVIELDEAELRPRRGLGLLTASRWSRP